MPEISKRYQVLVRAKDVLSSIRAGDEYFYTPGHVEIGSRVIDEVKAFPAYFISLGSAGGEISEYTSGLVWEAFDLVIDGWVKGNEDVPLMVEKAISDVRKAIMKDYENLSSGLGSIVLTLKIKGGPETDEGALASLGFGFFEQRFTITIENL